MNYLKNIFLFIVLTTCLMAQTVGIEAKIAELAKKSNDAYFSFSKESFAEVWSLSERILSVAPDNEDAKYFAALTGYRLLNIGLNSKDKAFLTSYYDKSREYCDALMESEKYGAEARVVKAGVYMMKIATAMMEAPVLTVRIHNNLDEADQMDKGNSRSLLVRGIMALNTPEMFGGSAEQAEKLFEAALENSKKEDKSKLVSWGLEESYAWLGRAYTELGKYDSAKKTYKEVLEIKPDFNWVSYKLLPSLEKRIKKVAEEKGL